MKKILLVCIVIISLLSSTINAAAKTVFSLDNAEGDCGSEIKIPVRVSGNVGFASFIVDIEYDDSYLTPKAVKNTEILQGELVSNLNYNKRTVRVVFASSSDVINDGELFYVTFHILENIAGDVETLLKLNLTFLSNVQLQVLYADTESGNIKISKNGSYIPIESPSPTPQPTSNHHTSSGGKGANVLPDLSSPKPTIAPMSDEIIEEKITTFVDLTEFDWAKEAIISLAEKGIIKGISDTNFAPSDQITRADFIILIVRLLKLDVEVSENFIDVDSDKYYYKEIGMAKTYGLTKGEGGNKFNPEDFISRQDMFVTVYRILKDKNLLSNKRDNAILESFSDQSKIDQYAKEAVEELISLKLIQGSDSNINPRDNATRAETAVFISKLVGHL